MAADSLLLWGGISAQEAVWELCRLTLWESSNSPEDCQHCGLEAGAAVQPVQENIPNAH